MLIHRVFYVRGFVGFKHLQMSILPALSAATLCPCALALPPNTSVRVRVAPLHHDDMQVLSERQLQIR